MHYMQQAAALAVEPKYPVNIFRSVSAPLPILSAYLTSGQLAARLSRVMKAERKELAPLVTLARYRPGAKTRKIIDIEAVLAVYGDIDRGFDLHSFESGMRELELAGFQVIAHQTYRHTDEAPRWRIYVLLDEPIPPVDYLACWEGLNAMFGGMLDRNAKDAARLNYWPSCPPGQTREVRTLNIAAAGV